jgi:hypothetical protein
MSEDIQQDAAELAKRSRSQAKNSAKNAGRAVKAVAEPVVDATAEEVHEYGPEVRGHGQRTRWRRFVGSSTRVRSPVGSRARPLPQGFIALSGLIYGQARSPTASSLALAPSSRATRLAWPQLAADQQPSTSTKHHPVVPAVSKPGNSARVSK